MTLAEQEIVDRMPQAKRVAFLALLPNYKFACLDHWMNDDGTLSHSDYTNDDEYGNCCAGPADGGCPVCDR